LADTRLELGQIAWQINDNVALFSIYGIQFDTKFDTVVIGFTAAVAGHASHSHLASRNSREITNRNSQRKSLLFARLCNHADGQRRRMRRINLSFGS
jgi:hypothetical protein